ncbi:hypothetical protein [Streptomyces sp. 8L]|uniref:hypothetical protein n=1 Tax=Streptomyces sp. 8L TaxID=2877242 RepID=UPI001CD27FD7|nr:hypothetical protein [Streptomyces sp. 8L]MCA1217854.1 hypothetical protein [Streptomyces sp. 8L]
MEAGRFTPDWTATDACAATPGAGSSATVGGPQPYWQSWTYDDAGDRSTQTDHDVTGDTSEDTTATYVYPAQGSASDQPHTLTGTSATGPEKTAQTASYTYDAAGDETARTTESGTQTMSWDDQGNLASLSDTATGGTSTYLYDTDGSLVLRTDPGEATLFLDGEQITENTSTGAISGNRYYDLAVRARSSRNALATTSSTSSPIATARTPSRSTTRHTP